MCVSLLSLYVTIDGDGDYMRMCQLSISDASRLDGHRHETV